MKIRKLLSLVFLLAACSNQKNYIDPEMVKYTLLWESTYGNLVNIDVKFGMTGKAVGICNGYSVVIDKNFWDKSNDITREILIFHELGHCIFGLEHREELVVANGQLIPKSIMYPTLINDSIYSKNRQYYLEELRK